MLVIACPIVTPLKVSNLIINLVLRHQQEVIICQLQYFQRMCIACLKDQKLEYDTVWVGFAAPCPLFSTSLSEKLTAQVLQRHTHFVDTNTYGVHAFKPIEYLAMHCICCLRTST
jgi:hypothetical protein